MLKTIAGAAMLLLASLPATAQDLATVRVGTLNAPSNIGLYIADSKGWFKDEGLKIEYSSFDSGARMVAPLGADQLDIGFGSASAGLYNAISRDISVRIVADVASSPPGYGATKLLVRKDLVDSGRYKGFKDLKGMTIGMNAPGVSNTATLHALLQSVGLPYASVKTLNMPFPQHVTAYANKAIDASVTIEPIATIAVQQGLALVEGDDDKILPGHQIAALVYSESFADQHRDQAMAFMRAYLRGVRYYNDALKDSHLAGRTADDVMTILGQYTPFKDKTVLRAMTPTGMDPNGKVNIDSLIDDYKFYDSQGLIEGKVDLKKLVDTSFADAAVQKLGPYKPNN